MDKSDTTRTVSAQGDYDVRAYGARGDGASDDALAIQRAIDACAASGGGRVTLGAAGTFLSGPIVLRSCVEFHVDTGATLKLDRRAPLSDPEYPTFISAVDCTDLRLTGGGRIDGNSQSFEWRGYPSRYCLQAEKLTNTDFFRPTLISLRGCRHVTVQELTLANTPFWNLHFVGCTDVLALGLRVLNRLDTANSDGIDIDHCRDVRIIGCHIEAADDCVCLKTTGRFAEYGPTENVIVSGCTIVSTSAAVKIGTESHNDTRNVLVKDCMISRTNRGLSIQLRDHGNVENVSFCDITVETRRFSDEWWGRAEPIYVVAIPRTPETAMGKIRHVRFRGIYCRAENGIVVIGSKAQTIDDIDFSDIHLEIDRRTTRWHHGETDLRPWYGEPVQPMGAEGFHVEHARRVRMTDVTVVTHGRVVDDMDTVLYRADVKELDWAGSAGRY